MSTTYTNLNGIDLSLAVWLVSDEYDFVPTEKAISVTSLMKPIRQIVLSARASQDRTEDLSSRIALQLGHAIHDSVERAWVYRYEKALASLDIPQQVIDRFVINPKPEDLKDDSIPVWIENRAVRELNGWKISGKFDMSLNYRLKDFKSTSVFTYMKGRKDENYRQQGSAYRWIHRDKVKEDEIDIQFLFTDYSAAMSASTPGYPVSRLLSYTLPLYTLEETENWLASRLDDLDRYMDAPQEALPRCTDEELWRGDSQWKYYSDPTKTDGRATKNFDDAAEANRHKAEKGKGVVIHVPGKVKACLYCQAFNDCDQRKEYTFD